MKKGFTLIELLATIIVLAVISMIAVGVVSNSINSSKKKTFEINASNLLDATKDYVTKSMENNDFPEGGIEADSKELGIKNNPFTSGIIKRNKEGQIVLEEVTDGKYCANGPKSNIEITEGNCEATDDTPPTLKIKELKTTTTNSKIMIKTQDNVSGIEKYTYCIEKIEEDYKEEDCVIVEKNKEKKLIKEIKEIEQLEIGTNYKVKVTAKDGKGNETTKEIQITTKELEEPKFKISTTTYALIKKLIITYPEADERYKKYYQIGEEEPQEETDLEKTLEIKGNVKVRAYVEKDGQEIVSSEIDVVGLDQEGPEVNVTIPNLDDWTKEKTMVISAEDKDVGLALKPYINNGYEEKYTQWNRENSVILKSSGVLNIKVRDRLGNVNQTFKLNGINCNVDTEDLCGINRVDSVAPKIEIKVIEGTTIKNEKYKEWYNSNSVTVEIKMTDYYLYNGEEIIGGSGVDESTLKVKVTNQKTSEQFTPTKIGENNYQIKLTKSGENKIEVSVSDNVGNKGTANLTVKIDNKVPVITSKSNTLYLDKSDYTFTSNLNVTYGPTGGTTICNPAESEKTGIYTVTCKATGNNGLTAEVTFKVSHTYSPSTRPKTCHVFETHGHRIEEGGCCSDSSHGCGFPVGSTCSVEVWKDIPCGTEAYCPKLETWLGSDGLCHY